MNASLCEVRTNKVLIVHSMVIAVGILGIHAGEDVKNVVSGDECMALN